MKSAWVELTEVEMLTAAMVGMMRYYDCVTKERVQAFAVNDELRMARDINGAAGEIAVAKILGRYWGGPVGTFKQPDIGSSLQVKTAFGHDRRLIVRPAAQDRHAYVLVTGAGPRYAVRGWMWASEAKRDEWLHPEYGGQNLPAYFVPQEALRPIRRD